MTRNRRQILSRTKHPSNGPVLPAFAHVRRDVDVGEHPYLLFFPGVLSSPAMARIMPRADQRQTFIERARVRLVDAPGFAYIDDEAPCIVLAQHYLRQGSAIDLYLDLLHELTHLRQLAEGHDVWDESFSYPDRPTEVEAYAVAIEEGRRLGMDAAQIREHVESPWMSAADVDRLISNVERFLGVG